MNVRREYIEAVVRKCEEIIRLAWSLNSGPISIKQLDRIRLGRDELDQAKRQLQLVKDNPREN